ncbi:MAG: DUF3313 family protein [Pseudomonadota bacterium]
MKRKVGHPFKLAAIVLGASAMLAGCASAPPAAAEVSDDGLQRVDVSLFDELYVAPGVSLANYQRVMLDPIEITFKKDWRKQHPDLSDREFEAFRGELARLLREKLVAELAHGGYTIAESPDKDVIRLRASIEKADFAGPEPLGDKKTLAYTDGEMTLRVLGFDGPSGALIARAKDYEEDSETQILERADRISAYHNAQKMFAKWAEALRSALDVAKVRAGARSPNQ